MERYSRNCIYISESEQEKIRNTKILLAGAGLGSVIAECALRMGFESITIIDGDKIEESNLNRQNYTTSDIGKYKAERLAKYLQKINPNAQILHYNAFIDDNNVNDYIDNYDIAINALDFKSDIPFKFDRLLGKRGIPVLHPYNFGWAGFVTVVKPGGYQLNEISSKVKAEGFELEMAEYVAQHAAFWNQPYVWLQDVIDEYKKREGKIPQPQLSVASWFVAALCTKVMYNIATNREIIYFPKFYISEL